MIPLTYYLNLYGEKVDIIRPIDDVISPSNAIYQKTKDFVVEPYVGNQGLVTVLYIKMSLKIFQSTLQLHLFKN